MDLLSHVADALFIHKKLVLLIVEKRACKEGETEKGATAKKPFCGRAAATALGIRKNSQNTEGASEMGNGERREGVRFTLLRVTGGANRRSSEQRPPRRYWTLRAEWSVWLPK